MCLVIESQLCKKKIYRNLQKYILKSRVPATAKKMRVSPHPSLVAELRQRLRWWVLPHFFLPASHDFRMYFCNTVLFFARFLLSFPLTSQKIYIYEFFSGIGKVQKYRQKSWDAGKTKKGVPGLRQVFAKQKRGVWGTLGDYFFGFAVAGTRRVSVLYCQI